MNNFLIFGFSWYLVFLFSLVCHEAAHAFAAKKLGDDTAYEGGQVSLDPMPHIRREPFGMLLIPIMSYITGGWMFGWASAPIDPMWAYSHPKRSAIVSLAGPLANLILTVFSMIFIRIGVAMSILYAPETYGFHSVAVAVEGGIGVGVAFLLSVCFSLNILLFAFNLLPLSPLDGSGVVILFMNEDFARKYMEIIYQPTFQVIGIILAWRFFDVIGWPIINFAVNILYFGMTSYS